MQIKKTRADRPTRREPGRGREHSALQIMCDDDGGCGDIEVAMMK